MEMFYDYLAATAGIVVGIFGALLAVSTLSCVMILALAGIISAVRSLNKKQGNVVKFKPKARHPLGFD